MVVKLTWWVMGCEFKPC